MEEAGFALVEAFGVERFFEAEEFVIEVVAEFVEEGPEESTEGDDPTVYRRAHPHADARGSPALGGCVEAVQFAPVLGGTRCQHLDLDRGYLEPRCEGRGEILGHCLDPATVLVFQCLGELLDQRGERCRLGQRDRADLVALPVDALLAARQSTVIRKDHPVFPCSIPVPLVPSTESITG